MGRVRLLGLYLRARGVPYAATGLVTLLALTGWNAQWLGWTLPDVVLVFVTVLAAVLLAGSFATPSPELDASAALPWWRWRLGHTLISLALCALPLAVAVAFHRHGTLGLDPTTLRNTLGFTGLALLTATLTGARLSWTLPLTYALTSSIAWTMPAVTSSWARAALWPVLSPNTLVSWLPALAFGTLGTLLITTRGASPSAHD